MSLLFTRRDVLASIAISIAFVANAPIGASDDAPPNVLFLSIDDLNDWTGCLAGHPQAKTPNIDRLAAGGVLFRNAHCSSPSCNPSRTAVMTGMPCYRSGLYDNRQRMRTVLPDAELIPRYFSRHGYWSAGSGKILHYFIDQNSWDDYFPDRSTENPFPRTLYPENRPVSLPRGGSWQYVETDWGPLDVSDEEFGGDWLVSDWIGKQLRRQHDKPFFLACGIYRPHEPWFVPKKYFDQFPLEEIQLPPGYRADDLDDLPPAGRKRGPNRYFEHILQEDQWKRGVQGYLASIAFADAMVGRVLDALEQGPNADNTIVVLWSDHGWHLGEKQHWQKYTAWRLCSRVPLIIQAPRGVPGLPQGTTAGQICDQPVSLASLYSTLTDIAGLPPKEGSTEPSLVPILKDPESAWPHVAITHLQRPNNYGISGKRYRYIHYDNGDEELYDIQMDPYEWTNLADDPAFAAQKASLRARAPHDFAQFVPADGGTLPALTWHTDIESLPPAIPNDTELEIFFHNKSGQPVEIVRVDADKSRHSYGILETGWFKPYTSRSGQVWLVKSNKNQLMGYFLSGNESAQAVIP
ncbi:Choline-sulfatase [Allorhodopirellula solitaria]|uniref:Choline-sulfatase n=2 Tax=Allorhodopirellula solitaria TaxID=2527987 RepID=A0A5C5YK19_9BACT|nr:Choline-sulfatase [Allorhodopirellula solitaria]